MSGIEQYRSANARTVQVITKPAPRHEKSRMANREMSVKFFIVDLQQLWLQSGQPSIWALAERDGASTNHFEFIFQFATNASELPDFEDVLALLIALRKRTDEINEWRRRWERLNFDSSPLTNPTAASPSEPTEPGGEPQNDNDEAKDDRPVRLAQHVESPEEFVEQLRVLRQRKALSYQNINDITKGQLPASTAHWMLKPGNFPARKEQVENFVVACDADPDETKLWITAYTRAYNMKRIQNRAAKKLDCEDSDASQALETIGDELARNGQLVEAIDFYKEALAQLRCS